jgi:hypothetical protein
MATRDELVAAIVERYARRDRGDRGRILDEFVAVPQGSTASTRRDFWGAGSLADAAARVHPAASMTRRCARH